jgi:hypothetical protein
MKKLVLLICIGLFLGFLGSCAEGKSSADEDQAKTETVKVIDSLSNELKIVSSSLKNQSEAVKQSLDTLLEDN